MRGLAALALLLSQLICACACAEEATLPPEVTGLEWMQLSTHDRAEQVLRSMATLENNGVKLSRALNDYYNALHQHLRQHPELYGRGLTSILASRVYDTEPSTRPALDALRRPTKRPPA